jgi:hypothetical protein
LAIQHSTSMPPDLGSIRLLCGHPLLPKECRACELPALFSVTGWLDRQNAPSPTPAARPGLPNPEGLGPCYPRPCGLIGILARRHRGTG